MIFVYVYSFISYDDLRIKYTTLCCVCVLSVHGVKLQIEIEYDISGLSKRGQDL